MRLVGLFYTGLMLLALFVRHSAADDDELSSTVNSTKCYRYHSEDCHNKRKCAYEICLGQSCVRVHRTYSTPGGPSSTVTTLYCDRHQKSNYTCFIREEPSLSVLRLSTTVCYCNDNYCNLAVDRGRYMLSQVALWVVAVVLLQSNFYYI